MQISRGIDRSVDLIVCFHIVGHSNNQSILTTININVNHINTTIINCMHMHQYIFLFIDIVVCQDVQTTIYGIEFFNTLNLPCMSLHRLVLKVDNPVILLYHLDVPIGLCNSTCIIIVCLRY